MKHRISRISVHQTASVVSLVLGLVALVVAPLLWLAALGRPEDAFPFRLAIVFPIVYVVLGYMITALGAVVYNAIAARFGGVELNLSSLTEECCS